MILNQITFQCITLFLTSSTYHTYKIIISVCFAIGVQYLLTLPVTNLCLKTWFTIFDFADRMIFPFKQNFATPNIPSQNLEVESARLFPEPIPILILIIVHL